jgi:hypothetical protein
VAAVERLAAVEEPVVHGRDGGDAGLEEHPCQIVR